MNASPVASREGRGEANQAGSGRRVDRAEFAARLDPLGPFEPHPTVAVAVSGGADSMALALLAADWARARGGNAVGLIVDHGLRSNSGLEAREAAARLTAQTVNSEILPLQIAPGPALASRARAARYAALEGACARRGIVHLLLGHHADDQAETVVMRAMAGSFAAGLAGMAVVVETNATRWLRPLLMIPPGRLRATLRARGVGWCEDPSNADPASIRARIRHYRGTVPQGAAPVAAASRAMGQARAENEAHIADWLAEHAEIHAEGYASIPDAPMPEAALATLVRMISGTPRPPRTGLAALARAPRPATLGGARLLQGGRTAPGRLLLVREARAMAADIPAVTGAVWDGRFRLNQDAALPQGAMFGALGANAARLTGTELPAALRRTLPVLRVGESVFAVSRLVQFAPAMPAACAPFAASPDGWAGVDGWGCEDEAATLC